MFPSSTSTCSTFAPSTSSSAEKQQCSMATTTSPSSAPPSSRPHLAQQPDTRRCRLCHLTSLANVSSSAGNSSTVRMMSAMVLLLAVSTAVVQRADATMPNEWEEQRMCGRLLIQALKTVCNHQYAQPNRDNFYETAAPFGGPLRARRRAPAQQRYMVKRRRGLAAAAAPASPSAARGAGGGTGGRSRRGIIWECCTNKCSLHYIRNNYCAAPDAAQELPPAPAAFQLVDDDRRRRRR